MTLSIPIPDFFFGMVTCMIKWSSALLWLRCPFLFWYRKHILVVISQLLPLVTPHLTLISDTIHSHMVHSQPLFSPQHLPHMNEPRRLQPFYQFPQLDKHLYSTVTTTTCRTTVTTTSLPPDTFEYHYPQPHPSTPLPPLPLPARMQHPGVIATSGRLFESPTQKAPEWQWCYSWRARVCVCVLDLSS